VKNAETFRGFTSMTDLPSLGGQFFITRHRGTKQTSASPAPPVQMADRKDLQLGGLKLEPVRDI
jgi:hypothetical protein